ncbi:GNAT family N-acetyltransferase [Paenibacillus woosongensis]|uniref:GNAT family N-acetyltransferase n=1 Tax=Paenibacillus woosongensis TaxID=307580 RepID=A0A7X2YYU5_9BACL|nr:GNAT family N-acetyltransferase [Paenibacillus woosongensis]MUG43579.1 GNAT family N-acetyltransferase [Paenibacillus woosongensis]
MDIDKLFRESPEFLTNRIYLRRFILKDISDYYDLASDPDVTAYTMWNTHRVLDESQAYVDSVLRKYNNKEAYHWGIIARESGKLIGRTGFISFDVAHDRTEIGFVISKKYWGQGIVVEATREILCYAFDTIGINRVEGRCNHDNVGSRRVMEKLGMKFEGILRKQLKIKGNYTDQKLYSLVRDDLQAV